METEPRRSLGLKNVFINLLWKKEKAKEAKPKIVIFFTAWTGGFLEIWEESSFGAQKSLHQLLVEGRKSQTSKLGGLVFLFL